MPDDNLHLRRLAAVACRDRLDESLATLREHLERFATLRPLAAEDLRAAILRLEQVWSRERRRIEEPSTSADSLRLTQFDERVEAVSDDLVDITDAMVDAGLAPRLD